MSRCITINPFTLFYIKIITLFFAGFYLLLIDLPLSLLALRLCNVSIPSVCLNTYTPARKANHTTCRAYVLE